MKKLIRYNSPVVLTYALLCMGVLLLDTLTGGWTTVNLFMVYHCSLRDPLTYFRFFGHVLGHAGWSHLISNLMYLLLVGPALEEKYGSRNLFYCILATALVTGVFHFIFFTSGLYGASGVVFMMIVLMSFSGTEKGGIPLTLLMVLALWIGNEIITGLSSADNVSQFAHILGGAVGLISGFRLRGVKRK